jgi:hypothetical protein
MASSAAADRIMAGNAQPGDAALLRAGERSIEFLMGKVVS